MALAPTIMRPTPNVIRPDDLPTILQQIGGLLTAPGAAQPAAAPAPAPSAGSVMDSISAGMKTAPLASGRRAPEDAVAAGPVAQPVPPLRNEHRGLIGDLLDDVFLGGAIQSHRKGEYNAKLQNYNTQRTASMLDAMDPEQRKAALLNPGKLGESLSKNYEPTTLSEGQSVSRFAGRSPLETAPKTGVDEKSGVAFTQTPTATTATGQFGGDYAAKDGLITSGRTGGVNGTYSQFQAVPLGTRPGEFTPSVGGPGAVSAPTAPQPATAAPVPAPAAGPAPNKALPLPLRQNNPGALKPLQGEQTWQGQTGVGPGGHAIFDTPENGARAALMNLRNKQVMHGLSTLQDIIAAPGLGWDPGNAAYVRNVSVLTGIPANQPVDLKDDATLAKVANAIFSVENGPAVWKAYQSGQGRAPQALPAQAPAAAAPAAAGGPGWHEAGPAERIAPPHAVPGLPGLYQEDPEGKLQQMPDTAYGPGQTIELQKNVTGSPEYQQAQAALSAYKAMMANGATMTGPSAYAILDTFARAINPGAVARPQVIDTIEKNLGIPAHVVGAMLNATGQGNLSPDARQQIIDAVVPFAQSHWDQANALNERNRAFAQRHGINPEDVVGPLDRRPERFVINPKVGDVVKGWRYLGGNKADPKSWAKP